MKSEYRRMYETKNVRPYYTIPHLGCFGKPLKELTGFGYERSIYLTSKEMNNEGYHEVEEMARATEHFKKIWEDTSKTQKLLDTIKAALEEATRMEVCGWKQTWVDKDNEDLLSEMRTFYHLLFKVFTRMLVSQPQHVLSLDQKINELLEGYSNRDELLPAATYYPGDLPWTKEEEEIERLHDSWQTLSKAERQFALQGLVDEYGWFNEIEGDQPFDAGHYHKKIIEFERKSVAPPSVQVPENIRKIGNLIGELGYLRFWNRYHFMSIRYQLKRILDELIKRDGNADLEFATIEEMAKVFSQKPVDLKEIHDRKEGYASHLLNGMAEIVTRDKAEALAELVREEESDSIEVRGSVASKGKVLGRVRIISFTASDYSRQVSAFEKGEILVTGMTRPQIVHLCQKAAAIVTDEGGITSHAAVVSREFGIPCIIATHNATRILKTGDMVEVDANQGIVTKINQ